jgi:hypothetical protein
VKVAGCVAGIAVFLILVLSSFASPAESAKMARGKYLVEGVGMCGDCHTPRNEKGEPIPGKMLKGATLTFKPAIPIPVWADKTPNIAGLPGWSDDQAVKFLMSGIAYNDLPGRPPMPQYRFSQADAEAVVVYLRSLEQADK